MSHAVHFCAVYCSCLRFGSKAYVYLYKVCVLLLYCEIVGSFVTRLWAGGPGSLLPGSGKGFFIFHGVQIVSWATHLPIQWYGEALALWLKQVVHDTNHSSLSSAKF